MTKKKSEQDPWAAREAQRYEHPIKSREFILQYLTDCRQLLSLEQLANAFKLSNERDLEALSRRLSAMVRDGQLVRNRRGAYGVTKKMDLVRGRIIGHPDGFGFLVPDDGEPDIYLSHKQMRPVMHGDRVIARVMGLDRKGRREGAIVEVLESNTRELVGRFHQEGGLGFVAPSNKYFSQDVIIPPSQEVKATVGQIVVVAIVEQPSRRSQPVGRIVEVLGDHMAPGMEVEIAIRSCGLPRDWPAEVLREMDSFPTEVSEEDKAGREDISSLPLVTIDGEDARDFDDAVFCEPHGKGWRLIVAIADVSSYVLPGAALDNEALSRGNSVYFPQQVIPMLPELLSNHLCSLRPEVDRLCMACELFITPAGRIRKFRFFEAVIFSHARLTYDDVATLLSDEGEELRARHRALLPHLQALNSLYQVLRSAREKRGAIDFERIETRIVFGAQRKIDKIIPVIRNDAHRMIEEFMIAANIAAAEFLLSRDIPSVYRTHPEPSPDKINDLRSFLSELGLSLGGRGIPGAKQYARLLSSLKERPDKHLIETVLLRSMSQAIYSADNSGHFGLALEAYTHFTSPIRRYPDLIIHRAIRHLLDGRSAVEFQYRVTDMQSLGDHCSMTDRRADEATRDAISWLKCEYMMDKVGQEFPGIVTAVTGFGLFVELDDIYVEGLVHVTALENDYYHFDAIKHQLHGERSGLTYRLADCVQVQVARVDLDERKIDFVLCGAETRKVKKKAGRASRSPLIPSGAQEKKGRRKSKSKRRKT